LAAVIAATALSPERSAAEGLVLVPGSDGTFKFQRQASGFARHYGSDGKPVLPALEPTPAIPDNALTFLDRQEPILTPPRGPLARPEIVDAIERTALRYGGHAALRKAGMSVTDWHHFFRANIEIESAYNPQARSHVGAIGLGQLMPATAATLGVNPHDMHQNLDGSARYLLLLLDRFGTKELALAGYNAGPEAVSRHGGIPPYRETIGHVRKVMAVFSRLNGDTL
jgi:hypothetical protein